MLPYKIRVGAPTIILNNELISELGLVFYGRVDFQLDRRIDLNIQ